MIIINGTRVNEEPLGELLDPDGHRVLVFRDNIASAYMQAVGRYPSPPDLLDGGSLIPTYSQPSAIETALPVAYTYEPGPHDHNQDAITLYKEELDGWNARAATIKTALDLMLMRRENPIS